MSIAPLKEKYPGISDHEVVRRHMSIPVGGVADYFLEVFTLNELIEVVSYCQENKINFRVVGGGTMILVSDYGFPGLIIKNSSGNISIIPGSNKIIVDSGVSVPRLITYLANNNIGGLEFLSGEKGTIGGAIYNNKQGYFLNHKNERNSINNYLKKLTILSPRGEALSRSPAWLQPGSGFTKIKIQFEKSIILTAVFQLYQSRQEDIVRKMNEVSKPKHWNDIISGDIFCDFNGRNASQLIHEAKITKLKDKKVVLNPDCPNRLALKQKNASANEVRVFIEKLRQTIFDKTNVMLEENIEYLGQW